MRNKKLERVGTVVLALSMLTVYVAGSQRRHNQGAFVVSVAADNGALKGAAGRREMVAYGSKSGPVFVPETPPVNTNAAKAANSAKVKKSSKGTNVSKANGPAYVVISQPHDMVASSSKSAAVFAPGDVKFITTTNKATVKPQGK